jgi:chemotaxis signal transduction protein
MDDLLREFLTETSESLDTVGGVHRLDGQLMVVLDVDRVLELAPKTSLAA